MAYCGLIKAVGKSLPSAEYFRSIFQFAQETVITSRQDAARFMQGMPTLESQKFRMKVRRSIYVFKQIRAWATQCVWSCFRRANMCSTDAVNSEGSRWALAASCPPSSKARVAAASDLGSLTPVMLLSCRPAWNTSRSHCLRSVRKALISVNAAPDRLSRLAENATHKHMLAPS